MKKNEKDQLCARVVALMDSLDEKTDSLEYLEELENPVDILAGAMFAKGHLDGTLTISEATIPFIESTESELAQILEGLEEDEEDDEEDE